MTILYIDTTTNYLYSAISINNQITGEIKAKLDKDLSVFTLPKIKEMLEDNQVDPKEVDKLLVVNGPGSFTGVRIGVTIAKTYAWSLKKKISTVSSLKAMALSAKSECAYKVPFIDARRGYGYAAIYDENHKAVLKEQYMSIEALKCALEHLPGSYTIITNTPIEGLENNCEEYDPNFAKIVENCKDSVELNPHAVNPNYLKLTEAEEKQKEELI